MPFTITMPKLSPTMESGAIAKWHKKVGDHVESGEVLFEVATDKATIEYNALDDGFLKKILIGDGKEASVGRAVAIFTEKKDESIEGYIPEEIVSTPSIKEEAVIETNISQESKASTPASNPSLFKPSFSPEPPLENYQFPKKKAPCYGTIAASPLARKLAEQKGVDLSTVKGTGPLGRIIARDVDLGQPDALVAFGKNDEPAATPGSYELKPLSPLRKVIAKRLQESKTFIPHFYVAQDVRCDALYTTREQLKTVGIKLSVNDFIIRASALALKTHPEVNSGFDSTSDSIISFQTIDISVAVSVEGGLITPIIRHADFKNIGEISAEVKHLASLAKSGKLSKEEYMGGSFTISNLGMYGVSEFSAIINPPQAAILAVSGIEEKPVVYNGIVSIGKVLRITLSSDHRVIDGVVGAKFLKTLQKHLENPAILLV